MTADLDLMVILDEANRVQKEVLDSFAGKISAIYAAKSSGESEPFKVGSKASVGLTLNPGYAGRSDITGNVGKVGESLPVTIPEIELIYKSLSATQAQKDYEVTGTKLAEIALRCRETFSKEPQYDFGLRGAMKSIRIS